MSIGKDNSDWNYNKKKELFNSVQKLMFVTPSKWLKEEVEKSFLSEHPVEVIYNGIDLQVFHPTESSFREKYKLGNRKIILGVANVWTERKGMAVFQQLAEQLDDSYVIVLVGVDKTMQAKTDPRIVYVERTKNPYELAAIYAAADLYLNPSMEETMGLTTVEALACGTQVLVRNSTALPEIVQYDNNKIMMHGDLKKQIAQCMMRKNVVKENREMAMQYEKTKQYQKYVELYSRCMHQR